MIKIIEITKMHTNSVQATESKVKNADLYNRLIIDYYNNQ